MAQGRTSQPFIDAKSNQTTQNFIFEGIDLRVMEKSITESFPGIETAKNKDLVIVVGNTGAGKSTLVNYLLGHKINQQYDLGSPIAVIEPNPGQRHAKVGADMKSVTFYPEAFVSEEGVTYCDCPGFEENRGEEKQICTSINSEIAVKMAKSIKSIIVVIDINSLRTDRGSSFKKLSETLGQFFINLDHVAKSILFVITKASSFNPQVKTDFVKTIGSLINAEEENLSTLAASLQLMRDPGEYAGKNEKILAGKSKLQILRLIKSNADNIVLIDVFDQGRGRQEIVSHLSKLAPVAKDMIGFGLYDPRRVKFNKMFYDIIGENTLLLKEKMEYPIKISECERWIQECKDQVNFYEKQIKAIEYGEKTQSFLRELMQRIDSNKTIVEELKKEIDEREKRIRVDNEDLLTLKTDDPVLSWTRSVDQKQVTIEEGKWLFNNYLYVFSFAEEKEAPIFKVKAVPDQHGKFLNKDGLTYKNQKNGVDILPSDMLIESGQYKINYKYGFRKDGGLFHRFAPESDKINQGRIEVYLKKRHTPEARVRITQLDRDIATYRDRIQDLTREQKRLVDENIGLTSALATASSDAKEDKAKQKLQMEKIKKEYEDKIVKLKERLPELRNHLREIEEKIEANQKLLTVVASITRIMKADMPIGKEFLRQFDRLSNASLPAPAVEPQQSIKFRDPLTGFRIKNPVLVSCGDTFDYDSITAHFAAEEKAGRPIDACPCCHRKIDSTRLTPNLALKTAIEEEEKEFLAKLDQLTSNKEYADRLKKEIEDLEITLELKRMTYKSLETKLQEQKSDTKGFDKKDNKQASTKDEKDEKRRIYQALDQKLLTDLQKLKREGVKFDIRDEKTGDTLLHSAVAVNAPPDMLQFFIDECCIDVDILNNNNETPLYKAVEAVNFSTATFLKQKKANVKLKYGTHKYTLLQFILKKLLPVEFIVLIVQDELIEVNRPLIFHGVPLLHLVAKEGHIPGVNYVIKSMQADMMVKDADGHTALWGAAKNDKLEVMNILLQSHTADFSDEAAHLGNESNISPNVRKCLATYLAEQNANKLQRKKELEPLSKKIFQALSSEIKVEAKIAEVPFLEEVIRSALSNCPEATTLVQKQKEFLSGNKDEFKTSQPSSELFISFIYFSLLYKILHEIDKPFKDIKEWYKAIDKEKMVKAQPNKAFFIEFLHVKIKEFIQLSNNHISFKLIAYRITLECKSMKIVSHKLLANWIHDVLVNDKKLTSVAIDINTLEKEIISQLNFSLHEEGNIKKEDNFSTHKIIFNYRIQAAVDFWLLKNKILSDEINVGQIAQQLVEELRQHSLTKLKDKTGMKLKKTSVAYCIIKDVLLTYPHADPIFAHLKVQSYKSVFVNFIFSKLKNEKFEHFSTDVQVQETFKASLQVQINQFIKDNVRLSEMKEPGKSQKPIAVVEEKVTDHISDKQRFFIDYFMEEFERFYCMYKALDLKLVRRRQEKVDEDAKKISEYKDVNLTVEGYDIPVGKMGDFIAGLMVARKDKDVDKAAARIGRLFGQRTFDENSKIIRMAADYVAKRYELQINHLTTGGIKPFAECAAKRSIQYLTASDDNLYESPTGTFTWMRNALTNFNADKRYGPIIINDYKDPFSAITTGVLEGQSKDDQKTVNTETGQTWVLIGILKNVGFIYRENDTSYQIYRHPTLAHQSVQEGDVMLYGYCWIEAWEIELIKKAEYVLDKKVTIEKIVANFPHSKDFIARRSLPLQTAEVKTQLPPPSRILPSPTPVTSPSQTGAPPSVNTPVRQLFPELGLLTSVGHFSAAQASATSDQPKAGAPSLQSLNSSGD